MFEIFIQLLRGAVTYLLFLDALWDNERTFSEHLQLGAVLLVIYGATFLCLERVMVEVFRLLRGFVMRTFPRVGAYFTKELNVTEPEH